MNSTLTYRLGCDYGTIKTETGELIDLVQNPTVGQGGTPTTVFYRAFAKSRSSYDCFGDPKEYQVRWTIRPGREACEDESEACDWDDFEIREM